ncbi:MAG: hypothetical protein N2422_02545 [Rhodobacteraceae bacterium]|nr:hypothetical protein [Paracoccaceae bacterium]
MPDKRSVVWDLIRKWEAYRRNEPIPARFMTLKRDLYNVRNGVPGVIYPPYLVNPDDEIMAAVEHYFLCRAWVGNGVQPAWQLRAMTDIYNLGKEYGLTPRHNPARPVTPPSQMQKDFQAIGIADGEMDLKVSGRTAPLVAKPPTY